jgi:3-oxoacyl-[acyl-carrier-protein] synthase II
MVIPREDGEEVAITMKLALDSAGITPAQVDYINAHATSTSIGDAVEVKAIRRLFKSRADKIAVSATKSLIGHTLGAAGALGAVASTLSIHTGHIHPTANYDEPDPDCRLEGISRSAQERKVRTALVNSFGFGSNNATVVLKKFVL